MTDRFLLLQLRRMVYQRGIWQVDHVDMEGGTLSVQGWWLPPRMIPEIRSRICVNGIPLASCSYYPRPDVASLMDLDLGLCDLGFQGTLPLEALPGERDGLLLHLSYDHFPGEDTAEQDFYFCPNALPVPDHSRRRKIGSQYEMAFHVAGSTIYGKLLRILTERFGKTFDDCGRILDWGCGCGRVLRHLLLRCHSQIDGVDIDPDNIAWCREHYPRGNFQVGPLEPPLPVPDDAYDLIVGISVFTHLSEALQFRWLNELRRICRPGGVLLLTVSGDVGWFRNSFSLDQFLEWKKAGIRDCGADSVLDRDIGMSGYYRNMFHDPGYVRREWGKYFSVIDLVPGTICNFQDLVVLQKS